MRVSVYIHAYTFIGSNQQLQEKSHKLMYVIMSNPQSNKGETASARGFCSVKSSSQLCSRKPPQDAAVPMAKLSPTLQPPTPPWCHWARLSPIGPRPFATALLAPVSFPNCSRTQWPKHFPLTLCVIAFPTPHPPHSPLEQSNKKKKKLMGRELLSEAAILEPEVSEREEKKTHLIISVQKRVRL